jgi:DNA-binding LytR/AlgR family response regulator
MTKINAALLDDNKEQLVLNQNMLENNDLTTVVLSCTKAEIFINEIEMIKPDVLFLDLNLGDSYMTGMEVAFKLKLPTMFVSSNNSEYIREIEKLKREHNLCVDHITKPFTEQEFVKTVKRFLTEIQFFANQQFIYLDFGSSKRNKLDINSIVYLSSDKEFGAESNNKQIHFTGRKSENLIDFSFSKMEEKGFLKSHFVTIHKSFRVNKNHIKYYDKKTEKIEVIVFQSLGKTITKQLPVSENYQSELKKILK